MINQNLTTIQFPNNPDVFQICDEHAVHTPQEGNIQAIRENNGKLQYQIKDEWKDIALDSGGGSGNTAGMNLVTVPFTFPQEPGMPVQGQLEPAVATAIINNPNNTQIIATVDGEVDINTSYSGRMFMGGPPDSESAQQEIKPTDFMYIYHGQYIEVDQAVAPALDVYICVNTTAYFMFITEIAGAGGDSSPVESAVSISQWNQYPTIMPHTAGKWQVQLTSSFNESTIQDAILTASISIMEHVVNEDQSLGIGNYRNIGLSVNDWGKRLSAASTMYSVPILRDNKIEGWITIDYNSNYGSYYLEFILQNDTRYAWKLDQDFNHSYISLWS